MQYYINPMWFYWLQVIDGLRGLFVGLAVFSGAAFCCAYIYPWLECWDITDEKEMKVVYKVRKISFAALLVSVLFLVFVPSKETMIEMMIARQVTPQNVEAGVEAIKSAVDYVIQAIQNAK